MEEMAGEGAQIFFDILFVADHRKDVLEDPNMAPLCHGDGKTRLSHQGEESQCFQSHCLSACIRSANNKNTNPITHPEVDGNHLIFTLKREERVSNLSHLNSPFLMYKGLY